MLKNLFFVFSGLFSAVAAVLAVFSFCPADDFAETTGENFTYLCAFFVSSTHILFIVKLPWLSVSKLFFAV